MGSSLGLTRALDRYCCFQLVRRGRERKEKGREGKQ